jgi:hypothetical protein
MKNVRQLTIHFVTCSLPYVSANRVLILARLPSILFNHPSLQTQGFRFRIFCFNIILREPPCALQTRCISTLSTLVNDSKFLLPTGKTNLPSPYQSSFQGCFNQTTTETTNDENVRCGKALSVITRDSSNLRTRFNLKCESKDSTEKQLCKVVQRIHIEAPERLVLVQVIYTLAKSIKESHMFTCFCISRSNPIVLSLGRGSHE